MAALAASLAICVAASTELATSEAGSPASAAGAAGFWPFGFFGSVAAVPSCGAVAFGSCGAFAAFALEFLDAFSVVFEALVLVVVPLLFGAVLVAATMRARVSRLMIHL